MMLLDNKSYHFRIELLSTNVKTNRTIKHQHEQFVMEWQAHGLSGWVGKQLAGDVALSGRPQVCLPTFFILEQTECDKPVDLCWWLNDICFDVGIFIRCLSLS